MMLSKIFSNEITISVIAFRLSLSFILSGIIGFERERNQQPAGFRTHILIGIGSTLIMLLSLYVPISLKNTISSDPTRIAAQVVTGIGFLGAGAILKMGVSIKGLTTAATIWVMSAIGLTIGAGLYIAALITFGFALFTLIILDKFEKKIIKYKLLKQLIIQLPIGRFITDQIYKILKKFEITILSIDITESEKKEYLEYRLHIKIPNQINIENFIDNLHHIKEIKKIEISEEQ